MNDTTNPGEKTISVTAKKTFTLKRPGVERDTVRQSFSHGRTNTVVVEKKRKRLPGETKGEPEAKVAPAPQPSPAPTAPAPQPRPRVEAKGDPRGGLVLRQLSEDEKDARARALADAKVHEAEQRALAEDNARRRAADAERERREREEAERRQTEEDARRHAELEARTKAEAEARRRFGATEVREEPAAAPADSKVAIGENDQLGGLHARLKTARPPEQRQPAVKRAEDRRRGKLTLVNALEDSERERSLASVRRRREREKARSAASGPREKIIREVTIPETITIQELANRMAERSTDVVMMLMKQGQLMKASDVIDADLAQLIAEEFGHTVRRVSAADVELGLFAGNEESGDLLPRPPVVTIMGHVDHGKTTLLDAIRLTKPDRPTGCQIRARTIDPHLAWPNSNGVFNPPLQIQPSRFRDPSRRRRRPTRPRACPSSRGRAGPAR